MSKLILTEFNIYGCPLFNKLYGRTTVFVACPVKRDQIKLSFDDSKIREKVGNDIDVTLVVIDRGTVTLASKGNKEINNIIHSTYGCHTQYYPICVTGMIEINIFDKLKFIAGQILLHEHNAKHVRTLGDIPRIEYAVSLLTSFVIDNTLLYYIKQVIVMHKVGLYYMTDAIEQEFKKIYSTYDKQTLQTALNDIIKTCVNRFSWHQHELKLTTEDALLAEFIKSPVHPTDRFKQLFGDMCRRAETKSLNKLFPHTCRNIDKLPSYITDRVVNVAQRSPEWLALLSDYQFGRNGGLEQCPPDKDYCEFYYHLMRGIFAEDLVVNKVDYAKMLGRTYHTITIGAILSDKKKGSPAVAPDILLVSDDEIVPVEIKCIVCDNFGHPKYRRAVELAEKQLRSTLAIINNKQCKRAIITIVQIRYDKTKGHVLQIVSSFI
jgi:hypothetical protein